MRSGFKYVIPDLIKEYEFHGTTKDNYQNSNPNFENDVLRALLSIVNKREEVAVNNQVEFNKKQQAPPKSQQTFKPSLLLVNLNLSNAFENILLNFKFQITNNQKTKEVTYSWFKQLANNESLMKLAKKIPVFNKRADNLPEILITLYEYQVPLTRAVWYLKIIAYSTNMNEVKKKKGPQTLEVSSEWSIPLVKFMRDIFYRMQYIDQYNYQQLNNPNPIASNNVNPLSTSNLTLENFMNVENLNLIMLPIITVNYLTEKKLKSLWHFTSQLIR